MNEEYPCPRCNEFHRRAQAAESEAKKVIRQHDMTRLWRTVAALKNRAERGHRLAEIWSDRYYDEVEKIRKSGLVSVKHPGSTYQTGYLNILVDRLIDRARHPFLSIFRRKS